MRYAIRENDSTQKEHIRKDNEKKHYEMLTKTVDIKAKINFKRKPYYFDSKKEEVI